MKKLILILVIACCGVASADPAQQRSSGDLARARRDRRIGIGLLIGAGVSAALGIVFVGLAKSANNDVLANQTYHPDEAERRDRFQATDTAFFTVAGVAFASGMVFTFGN